MPFWRAATKLKLHSVTVTVRTVAHGGGRFTGRLCTSASAICVEVQWALWRAFRNTLYIEFRAGGVVETRDLDENTVLDMDAGGHICAITFEHASQRTDVKHLVVEGIAA
jgi:uncharacterized protein YuzE